MVKRGPYRLLPLIVVVALALPLAGTAAAHEERDVEAPAQAPFPEYRDTGPSVVVCKPGSRERIRSLPEPSRRRNVALLQECRFRHIQLAVNWVARHGKPGTRILVLPGIYREQPSRNAHQQLNGAPLGREDLADDCARIAKETGGGDEALSYAQQATCPHLQNLVAVFGDTTPGGGGAGCEGSLCHLQIQGTGARPGDVVIDGKLTTFLNGIRADRADGFYVTNLATQQFEFNGLYIIETAGATVDDVVGRYNHEYGFLSFVSHVRYENCAGHANGDSAVYPGGSPNVLAGDGLIPRNRGDMAFSTEVRGCRGHHNALGYSGTTGNAVFAHHNEFDHNTAGTAMESFFPGHPGTPQNHALFEDNLIHANNVNYYAKYAQQGNCAGPMNERDYEDGAVCPAVMFPAGTGIILGGGNFNWYHRNQIYDNWRTGTVQFWVPAELREGAPVPDAHFRQACGPDGNQACPYQETSHWNTYSGNRMAENQPHGFVQPNGVDFTWDLEGAANCWDRTGPDANTSATGQITYAPADFVDPKPTSPVPFPGCANRGATYSPLATNVLEVGCLDYDQATRPEPAGCDWDDPLPVPQGRQPAHPTLERLDGENPVGTAVLAAREGDPRDAPAVVLASSERPANALVGTPLAHARGGPLLLTSPDGLAPRVAAEIQRLDATTVYLVGGRKALSAEVAADVRRLGLDPDDIVRLGGKNRYQTAAAVARALPATDAFMVSDERWAGARTLGSVAALLERPILLTRPDELPPATAKVFREGSLEAVDVAGSPAAVSRDVQAKLARRLGDVERIGGGNRYEVALNIARFALQAGADPSELWLASGTKPSAAVAAGSAVAVDEGVMLLVGSELAGSPAARWFAEHPVNPEGRATVADVLERVRVLGGADVVREAVTEDLRRRYGAEPGDARGDRSAGNTVWTGSFDAHDHGGRATVTETLVGSTRVQVMISGLKPGRAYEAHVKTGSCADPEDDLRFADGGSLRDTFTTDPAGIGMADETLFRTAGADPGSVVIHDQEGGVVACASL